MAKRSLIKCILLFLPLLALYILLIIIFNSDTLFGDEPRHLNYAQNLVHGFYTHAKNPDLSNGPGYPLILLPFVALDINLLVPKLLNGVMVFIGILYFYKTISLYTNQKIAIISTFLIGLYPPMLRWMVILYSESLAFMLICGFIFHFCCLYQKKMHKWKNCVLASFFLGFLVLTKVVFFYVMLVSAIMLAFLFLAKHRANSKWAIPLLLLATVLISPYIFYAYSVTGKLFYLGTGGGELLYHRSTPYEKELGNWFSYDYVLGKENEINETNSPYNNLSELSANHRSFYLQLQPLSHIERDSAFKAKAFANMKEYPFKYLKNTVSNTGRFIFNYPFSYRSQNLEAYGYILPNMFLIVLFILIIYPAWIARKRIPFEIMAHLIYTLIYGGAMILLAAIARYFILMVPALVLFLVYIYTNILKINLVQPKN